VPAPVSIGIAFLPSGETEISAMLYAGWQRIGEYEANFRITL